jgi:hypothetical protein
VNFDLFVGHPSSSGPNHTSAKLEFFSKPETGKQVISLPPLGLSPFLPSCVKVARM